jgi:hypothetical protein
VQVGFSRFGEHLLEPWVKLYQHLMARHGIRGMARFSERSFACQLRVPGLVAGWAEAEGEIVGMTLWYVMEDRGYYHLGAYNETGYALKCSFALFWSAIKEFAAMELRWLCLGAGAGAVNDGSDGLTRFKQGWATGARAAYLCGRVFNPRRYQALAEAGGNSGCEYFPAYRMGEYR